MRLSRSHVLGPSAASIALVGMLTLATPRDARAQGSTAKVAAETLFEEARHLVADGKIAEACPKFAESQRLDPSPATLLNLASCYEKSARPATAWATYREGASSASALGRQDLVATAQRHADALYPTLPRLNVNADAPADGMTVAVDGVAVGRAEWGVAIPVDPGDHTVEATAPHFKPWSSKVTVGKDPTTVAVAIPALEAAPEEPVPAVVTPPAPSSTLASVAPATPDNGSVGQTQRAVGIVVGAVGIVGLGVGAALAVNAKSQYNGSLADCVPGSPNLCSAAGVNERNSAVTSGNVATAFVVVGGVALASGIVLWFTAPHPTPSGTQSASIGFVPTFAPGGGGGMVRATW